LARGLDKGGGRTLRVSASEAEAFVKSEFERWVPVVRAGAIAAESTGLVILSREQ